MINHHVKKSQCEINYDVFLLDYLFLLQQQHSNSQKGSIYTMPVIDDF